MTFCKLDGAFEAVDLEGGPKGGKGLVDIETAVGEVMAEELLLPREEPFPELADEGLELDPDPLDPTEMCFVARSTGLD